MAADLTHPHNRLIVDDYELAGDGNYRLRTIGTGATGRAPCGLPPIPCLPAGCPVTAPLGGRLQPASQTAAQFDLFRAAKRHVFCFEGALIGGLPATDATCCFLEPIPKSSTHTWRFPA